MQGLLKEAEGKKVLMETLEKRVAGVQVELESAEQVSLENSLRQLSTDHGDLLSALKAEISRVSDAIDVRRKLEASTESAQAWLRNIAGNKTGPFLPLAADSFEAIFLQQKVRFWNIYLNQEGNYKTSFILILFLCCRYWTMT